MHKIKIQKGCSRTSCTQQRSLHFILAQCPTTAGRAPFCLLCCQPEPIPRSLTARMPSLTWWDPCGRSAWLGRAIDMTCRTCCAPMYFNTQPRKATEDWLPPAVERLFRRQGFWARIWSARQLLATVGIRIRDRRCWGIYQSMRRYTDQGGIWTRPCSKGGLRRRNSPTCTLSQNGYGTRAGPECD